MSFTYKNIYKENFSGSDIDAKTKFSYDRNKQTCIENEDGYEDDKDECIEKASGCEAKGVNKVCCPPGSTLDGRRCKLDLKDKIFYNSANGTTKDEIGIWEASNYDVVNSKFSYDESQNKCIHNEDGKYTNINNCNKVNQPKYLYDRNKETCIENKAGKYTDLDTCKTKTLGCQTKGIKDVCCPPDSRQDGRYCKLDLKDKIFYNSANGTTKDGIGIWEASNYDVVNSKFSYDESQNKCIHNEDGEYYDINICNEKTSTSDSANYNVVDHTCKDKGVNNICCPPGSRQEDIYCKLDSTDKIFYDSSSDIVEPYSLPISRASDYDVVNSKFSYDKNQNKCIHNEDGKYTDIYQCNKYNIKKYLYDRNEKTCIENKDGNYTDLDTCNTETVGCETKGIKDVCCPPDFTQVNNICWGNGDRAYRYSDSEGIFKPRIDINHSVDDYDSVDTATQCKITGISNVCCPPGTTEENSFGTRSCKKKNTQYWYDTLKKRIQNEPGLYSDDINILRIHEIGNYIVKENSEGTGDEMKYETNSVDSSTTAAPTTTTTVAPTTTTTKAPTTTTVAPTTTTTKAPQQQQ